MKEWQTNLIGGIVVIIIGISMSLGGTFVEVPARYRTFFGIPYDVNPEFAFSFILMMTLILVGILFLGIGLGILANTYSIYRLEEKLASFKEKQQKD